jgi:hypothetical protein
VAGERGRAFGVDPIHRQARRELRPRPSRSTRPSAEATRRDSVGPLMPSRARSAAAVDTPSSSRRRSSLKRFSVGLGNVKPKGLAYPPVNRV